MKLKVFLNSLLCSRVFLAIHILMGRPVCYRVKFIGGVRIEDAENIRFVENRIRGVL